MQRRADLRGGDLLAFRHAEPPVHQYPILDVEVDAPSMRCPNACGAVPSWRRRERRLRALISDAPLPTRSGSALIDGVAAAHSRAIAGFVAKNLRACALDWKGIRA